MNRAVKEDMALKNNQVLIESKKAKTRADDDYEL